MLTRLSNGGAELQAKHQINALAELGHQVTVITLDKSDEVVKAKIRVLSVASFKNPLYIVESLYWIWKSRCDYVYTFFRQSDVAGFLSKYILFKKWIMAERSSRQCYKDSKLDKLRSWIGLSADIIICNSNAGHEYWVENGKDSGKVKILSNCYPNEIEPRRGVDGDDKGRKQISRQRLLYIGRCENEKNIWLLLLCMMESFLRNVDLVIIGTGSELRKLKDYVQEKGVANVKILGHMSSEEIRQELGAGDVLVSLSRYEGMSNSVAEAIIRRMPLILSDIEGHREITGNKLQYVDCAASIQECSWQIRKIYDGAKDGSQYRMGLNEIRSGLLSRGSLNNHKESLGRILQDVQAWDSQ
ncbi:glycosyltransferase family 4 protein [Synechococcus sp. NB0720_010]|uniref:glycosyltransferase family 4 protein n=1 Tax=Synechococcus sp. NB0720_010 TaxID=2907159 RepID=UPI001FF92966|nr:glycosyltransferase family 4 protein [Synechococcus sp. NB0720_010]UPH89129.1 glycosyltransferase family 4 protein [Synechococcus sp. NB0720_010]